MRRNRFRKVCVFLLIAAVLVVGCGKKEPLHQEEKKKIVNQEPDAESEAKNDEIPKDLLPAGKEKKDVPRQTADEKKSSSQAEKPQDSAETPKSEKPKKETANTDKKTIQVKISIECKAAEKEGYQGPSVLLEEKTLTLKKGASVYDALVASGVPFSGSGGYVAGISGVYEFDWGSESGWLYYVNGEKPNVGSNRYVCRDGDVIEWKYTTQL